MIQLNQTYEQSAIDLSIGLIGIYRCTQEYSTQSIAVRVMVGTDQEEHEGTHKFLQSPDGGPIMFIYTCNNLHCIRYVPCK